MTWLQARRQALGEGTRLISQKKREGTTFFLPKVVVVEYRRFNATCLLGGWGCVHVLTSTGYRACSYSQRHSAPPTSPHTDTFSSNFTELQTDLVLLQKVVAAAKAAKAAGTMSTETPGPNSDFVVRYH